MDGFVTLGTEVPWIRKRPGEVLDYVWDLSDYLGSSETLSGISVVADAGITIGASPAPAINAAPLQVTLPDGSSKTIAAGEAAVIWLSGGSIGSRYDITLTATSGARTIQRTFQVRVVE
jgi:hypothetical protein